MSISWTSPHTNYPSSRNWSFVVVWSLHFPRKYLLSVSWKPLKKAYWNIEPHLASDDLKELTAMTLRSLALDYLNHKGLRHPKTLLNAINELRNWDDIVVTKPDKGPWVVVMDKSEYLRLLPEASINDTSKFRPVDTQRPRTRGRPVKYYHPLLQQEKAASCLHHAWYSISQNFSWHLKPLPPKSTVYCGGGKECLASFHRCWTVKLNSQNQDQGLGKTN